MAEEDRVQFKLMMPAAMKAQLEMSARARRRSLSAEILSRLELTLTGDEMQTGATVEQLDSLKSAFIETIEKMKARAAGRS